MTTRKPTAVQVIGKEEDIIVETMGAPDGVERVPSAGKWLMTLSTIHEGEQWELVCTSQTPLRIQSISISEVGNRYGAVYPREGSAPGKFGSVPDFPDSFGTIVVNRVRPKR